MHRNRMVHKLSEHYNNYVYTNYFHNSWFVLHSHFHRIFQTHTMHTLYKHAKLHIPHRWRYTTTTYCDFNQSKPTYTPLWMKLRWRHHSHSFHSTTSVKFHHVTVNTWCYSMIHFAYTHVIVIYNFGTKLSYLYLYL